MLDDCGNLVPDMGAVAECSALGGKVRFGRHGFISVEPAEIEGLDDVLAISVGYLMSNGPRPFLLVL